MPFEAMTLTEYDYDTARDIVRVWTAFGTLLIPLCFFWHAKRSNKNALPEFLREMQGDSWRAALGLFRRRWWHVLLLLAIFWTLKYFVSIQEIQSETLLDVLDNADVLLYPLLSFSFLWCLKDDLSASPERPIVASTPSIVLTFMWAVLILCFTKGSAQWFGLFSMVYVLIAVRGDLTLALVFTRALNPVSAMWKSFQYSKGRTKQFAWTFSLLSGSAWLMIELASVGNHQVLNYLENLNVQLQPEWELATEILIRVPLIVALSFIDCLFLVRGVRFLHRIEGESITEGGIAPSKGSDSNLS